MLRTLALVALLLLPPAAAPATALPGTSCVGLSPPVSGDVVRGYEPTGRYAGHWGLDYLVGDDTAVRAAASGRVSFAGVVVDNRTVSIDHGGGLRTSYSYLAEGLVRRGASVSRGDPLGRAGAPGEHASLHFSVRLDGRYLDPGPLLGCRRSAPSAALRLVTP